MELTQLFQLEFKKYSANDIVIFFLNWDYFFYDFSKEMSKKFQVTLQLKCVCLIH